MSRDKEEVKYFILEQVMNWVVNLDDAEHITESRALRNIADAIDDDKMLTKTQATVLHRYVQNEILETMKELVQKVELSMIQVNLPLEVDSLSIYSDVWAIYCRPGTYVLD